MHANTSDTPEQALFRFAHEFTPIACPFEDAMALFGDPMRLPEWAVAWCQGVEQTPTGHVATTVEGPRSFAVRADPQTGIADICAGPDHDHLDDILHIRMVPCGPDLTLVSFVYAAPAEMPMEVLELMRTGLAAEAKHSRQLLEAAAKNP